MTFIIWIQYKDKEVLGAISGSVDIGISKRVREHELMISVA